MNRFDMHIHSYYSDGEYDIEKIIDLLKEHHIEYFSISDHDNIDSVFHIKDYDLKGLTYIKGVEISSILDNKYRLHILGYDFDEHHQEFNDLLNHLKIRRKKRFIELNELLKTQYNIYLPDDEINSILEHVSIPGKPHLGALLIKYNYVKTIKEAFDSYLKYLYPKYSNNADATYVIDIIHKANGKAILAHPKKYENQYHIDFHIIMDRLRELGIDGIEIYNSLHNYDDCIRYHNYALEYNLITTGGSDYHGISVKPHVKIGMLYKDKDEYSGTINYIKELE